MNTYPARRALLCILLAGAAYAGCNLAVGIEDFHAPEAETEGEGGAGGAPCVPEAIGAHVYAHDWSKGFSSADSVGVATTSEGHVYLAGSTFGPGVDFGGGPLDGPSGYVVKLDTDGSHLWSKNIPLTMRHITVGYSGGVVITGLASGMVDLGGGPMNSGPFGGAAVVVYDASGAYQWSRVLTSGADGGSVNEINGVAAGGGSGDVYVTGYFHGTIDFGAGPVATAGSSDVFVAKYDYKGSLAWSKPFGDDGGQQGHAIATDSFGNVLIAGSVGNMIDLGGGPLIGGGDSGTHYLAKLDANGAHIWSKLLGTSGLLFTYEGNTFLAGSFYETTLDFGDGPLTSKGGTDIFLAKYNGAGELIFSKSFGNIGEQVLTSAAPGPFGTVLLAGSFEGKLDLGGCPLASAGGTNMFVAKLDPQGEHLFSKRYGSEGGPSVSGIAGDFLDNIVITGSPGQTTIDFGGGSLDPNDATLYAARLAPPAQMQ